MTPQTSFFLSCRKPFSPASKLVTTPNPVLPFPSPSNPTSSDSSTNSVTSSKPTTTINGKTPSKPASPKKKSSHLTLPIWCSTEKKLKPNLPCLYLKKALICVSLCWPAPPSFCVLSLNQCPLSLAHRSPLPPLLTSVAHRHRHRPLSNGLLISGPWKQGWRVRYEGNEWDSETLKVFVVPHSHNDPGWKLTVEEYYDRQSRHILDTIVEALSKDPRCKFIWEEMSYLERWWMDASETKKESFINLVKNAQLEIVGGGWVMNDEANSHYFAIIEQMEELMKNQMFATHAVAAAGSVTLGTALTYPLDTIKVLIQISRSIGDVYLKKAEFNREPLYAKFRLREPFRRPILSAEPSICVHELQPDDRFLIFATDGLWEHLSNQEAVDIVQNHPCNESLSLALHVPGQRYCPPVEVFKSCCREVKKGCVRPNSSRYYFSFVDQGGEGNRSEPVEPHLVVQMDTESSVLYQKTCLDYCFEKPIKVPYITTALMDAKLGTEGRKDLFVWLSRKLSGLSNFPDAVNLNYVLFQIVMRDGCDL